MEAALLEAIAKPAADPFVGEIMPAGYSGTPLPRKLGIKEGSVVALLNAPRGFRRTLGELPPGVTVKTSARGRADLIVLFAPSRAVLVRRFPAAERALAAGGGLWLAWPKKASGLQTDLAEGDVRAFGLEHALVDYKIAAVDDTWSGLKFARRKR